MRICFFGSDEFALPALKYLCESPHELVAVITQPDRQQGRGLKMKPNAIATYASSSGIPVLKPESLKDESFIELLDTTVIDVAIVCAYGKILKKNVLEWPALGCINIHPSLLPRYRGATPIESAIMEGEEKTGVTIMYMDEGCDTGDILLQKDVPIDPEDTGGSLREKLSMFAVSLLEEALSQVISGYAVRACQQPCGLQLTRRVDKENTYITWEKTAESIRNFTRALWPKPSAQTIFRGKHMKVGPVKVTALKDKGEAAPGTIVEIRKNEGPVISASSGFILLNLVKPEGKKEISAWQFTLGYSPKVGERFGEPVAG